MDRDWCLFETTTSEHQNPLNQPNIDSPYPLFPASTMAAAGASPSSSPRLPSPPPFTEVQIGPKSPTVGDGFGTAGDDLLGLPHEPDDASTRRIRPGTKSADMASGPPLIPLSQLDSPFQLQEHLKALYQNYTRPSDSSTVNPITRDIAMFLAEPPEGVERSLWLYELCRFLTMKANNLIIAFFAENPPCSANTCPEMRASEWQYLCAVHDPPKSCCAIDYCCHTLDWATNILTSPKYFPSRLTLGSESAGGPQASMKHLTNIFRRVYRIFAHAWFQHREVFWQVEGHDGLYIFFKTVCDMYNLIPEDNYTVPAEAEGVEPSKNAEAEGDASKRVTILRKEVPTQAEPSAPVREQESGSLNVAAATTRRHKASPSTGIIVPTITEAAEDDDPSKPAVETPEEDDSVINLPSASNDAPLPIPSTEPFPDEATQVHITETEIFEDDEQSKSENLTPPANDPVPEEEPSSPEKKAMDVLESATATVDVPEEAIEEDSPEINATPTQEEPPKAAEALKSEPSDKNPDSPDAPTTAIEVKPDSDKPF
ncbi:hypothetical protein FQN50_008440 [Emmonsiellopsis sp. PD_5]|nr:hypothetical protein FQN50_008440 [Emmonsiellopsis sp. PD_5]